MRLAWWVACVALAGCMGQKLSTTPPNGVDLTGHWQLDEADSDDPQRVAMSQDAASGTGNPGAPGGSAPPGGGSGRGGRGGRGGSPPGFGSRGPIGPAVPAVSALSDGLRWPGKSLEITQRDGSVTMTSAGQSELFSPRTDRRRAPAGSRAAAGRDAPELPPVCGWDAQTLVIQADDPDDERTHFEERYSLSADGQRLIEMVAFKGGRSGGFTVSRVWQRVSDRALSSVGQ